MDSSPPLPPSLPCFLHLSHPQIHLCGLEGDGGEFSTSGGCAGGKGDTVGGATGNLGDPVVLEGGDGLGLAIADGAAVALLSMLFVPPHVHLGKRREIGYFHPSEKVSVQ